MTKVFTCEDGHQFEAPAAPKKCPVCVNGKGCPAAIR